VSAVATPTSSFAAPPSGALTETRAEARAVKVAVGVALLVPISGAFSASAVRSLDSTSVQTVGAESGPLAVRAVRNPTLAELESRVNLNRSQLAELLGVSRRSLYNWLDGAPMSVAHSRRAGGIAELVAGFDAPPEAISAVFTGRDGGMPLLRVAGQGAPLTLLAGHFAERLGRNSPLESVVRVPVDQRQIGGTNPAELARLYAESVSDDVAIDP
jgi:hypothetical protein